MASIEALQTNAADDRHWCSERRAAYSQHGHGALRSQAAKHFADRADAAKPPILKVADFGESRLEDKDVTMTHAGTKYYISPEIFRGERYGTSADIFSLGIILNQMDTLQHPSTGNHYDAMQRRLQAALGLVLVTMCPRKSWPF